MELKPKGSASPTKDTWAHLAAMRFVLAYGVFAFHLCGLENFKDASTNALWRYGAYAAVPLFLVISGYSIAASWERERDGYFERRLRRIYPVYLAAVAIACVPFDFITQATINTYGGAQIGTPRLDAFLATITLTQAVWSYTIVSCAPLWSLGVEWLFYMAVPVFARMRTCHLIAVCLVSVMCFWWASATDQYARSLSVFHYAVPCGIVINFTWLWLTGFLMHRHRESPDAVRIALLVPLVFVLTYAPYNHDHCAPSYALLLCLILLFPNAVTLPTPIRTVLNWLGDVSYPLYAVHFSVIIFLDWFWHIRSAWGFTGACLIAAIILHHTVDKPFRARGAQNASLRVAKTAPGLSATAGPEPAPRVEAATSTSLAKNAEAPPL